MPCGNAARQGWVYEVTGIKKPGSAVAAGLNGRDWTRRTFWKGWLARLPAGVVLRTGRKAFA